MIRSTEFENSKTERVQRAGWKPLGILRKRGHSAVTATESVAPEAIDEQSSRYLFLGADLKQPHPSLPYPSACLEWEVQEGEELESMMDMVPGQQL